MNFPLQYAINLKDQRIVLCTKQTLEQADYRAIDKDTVDAINNGDIEASEVVKQITALIRSGDDVEWTYEKYLDMLKRQNVRQTPLNLTDDERSETNIDPKTVKTFHARLARKGAEQKSIREAAERLSK